MFSQRKMVATDDYLETQLQLILINLDKSSNIFWWLLCDSFSLLEIDFNQMLVVGFWLSSALNAIIDLIGLHQPQCSHWPPPAQGHLPLSLLAFSWKNDQKIYIWIVKLFLLDRFTLILFSTNPNVTFVHFL